MNALVEAPAIAMTSSPSRDLQSQHDLPGVGVAFSPWVRRIGVLFLLMFVVFPLFALFAPWQQNVAGTGRVAAFSPIDRPQTVQAPVGGRVLEVFVLEGTVVEKGDPLVRIVDIDPEKISRIEAKLSAARRDLAFTESNIETLATQITILEGARDLAVDAFKAKVEMAREKESAAVQKLQAVQAENTYAAEQEQRLARLAPKFVSELKLLEARARLEKAAAGVRGATADRRSAAAALLNATAELGKERALANSKVESARVKKRSMSSKRAALQAKIADLEGELRAQNSQMVNAPRAGRVFRLAVNTDGSIVKSGEELMRIVPTMSSAAVELFVRGVDAPLIEPGRKVRLQFEGWPAVQFVGWPSVAVGTFGGVVSLIDATDSGNGRFRLLITPDPDDEKWPKKRWLRQGVRAKGWVLLNEVSLGYELWRQFNGFPPVVADSEPKVYEEGDSK